MREEIEELIFHMANLQDAIKKAKHPGPLKKEYAAHKLHLTKLFDIQELVLELGLEADQKHPIPEPPKVPVEYAQPRTQDSELLSE